MTFARRCARRTRTRPRAGGLATALLVLGVLGAVAGVAYDVNGMTQAHATVKVQVEVVPQDGVGGGWGNTQVEVPGIVVPDGWLAPARPTGLGVGGDDGGLTLAVWDSTRLEQGLARGGSVVGGLALLVLALLLRPVLDAIGRGEPFSARGGVALARSAAVVLGAGLLAPTAPAVASALVLARTGLDGPLSPSWPADPLPVLVALLLAVLAAAFRRGEQLARETGGLV